MSPIRFRLLGRLLETKAPKKEEAYPDIITIEDEEEGSLARIEPTEDLKRELEEKEERIRTLEAENRDLQEQLRLSAERVEEMEQEPSVLQHIIIKKERLDEDDIQKLKELEEKANTYRRRAWKHEHFSNYRFRKLKEKDKEIQQLLQKLKAKGSEIQRFREEHSRMNNAFGKLKKALTKEKAKITKAMQQRVGPSPKVEPTEEKPVISGQKRTFNGKSKRPAKKSKRCSS